MCMRVYINRNIYAERERERERESQSESESDMGPLSQREGSMV